MDGFAAEHIAYFIVSALLAGNIWGITNENKK
jgi:hypothetical protein